MKSFQQKPAEIVSFPHGVNALVRENGGTPSRNRITILMQSRKPVFAIIMRWGFRGRGRALTPGARRADTGHNRDLL